ncbi:MAG: glycosyltransferase [Candidatus Bathyarchaeota archaeon]|nr:MAG: glycosyltransferase [Candidatus Bathyarchaeota archaeon]
MKTKIRTVSVVIPAFQEEKYIAATLSRLVNIDHLVEIIVVDGGSKDKTVEIAKRFTDKVYVLRKRGIARARNYGAERACGDVLVFLDADVVTTTDFVEKVLETFSDSTVVGATCSIMPVKPRFHEKVFFYLHNSLTRILTRFKPHSRGEFFVVRRSEFLKVSGFNESLPCSEDHELAFRLSKRGRFVFIKDLTVYESLRRFRKLGLFRVVGIWLANYLSFVIRGKNVSKVWLPVR